MITKVSSFVLQVFVFAIISSCNQAEGEGEKTVKNNEKENITVASENLADSVFTIYLTFDDGPLDGSEDIEDAITKEGININVFVVGQHALSNDKMKSYYQLYLDNKLIEVGNHSYSHAHNQYKKFYENPQAVLTDFLRCQDELKIPNKYARQPGRNQWRLKNTVVNDVNSGSKSADLLFQNGFRVFGWDIEWQHDAKTGAPIQTVDDMVEAIEKKMRENKTLRKKQLVLLAHDEMFRNGWEESELKELITTFKAKGNYHFGHLSNYPE